MPPGRVVRTMKEYGGFTTWELNGKILHQSDALSPCMCVFLCVCSTSSKLSPAARGPWNVDGFVFKCSYIRFHSLIYTLLFRQLWQHATHPTFTPQSQTPRRLSSRITEHCSVSSLTHQTQVLQIKLQWPGEGPSSLSAYSWLWRNCLENVIKKEKEKRKANC